LFGGIASSNSNLDPAFIPKSSTAAMAPSEQQQQQPNGTSTTSKKPAFNTIPEAIEAFGKSSPTLPIHPSNPPSNPTH
jgi:hypothetical protein